MQDDPLRDLILEERLRFLTNKPQQDSTAMRDGDAFRAGSRKHTHRVAEILLPKSRSRLSCVVRDVSDTGLRMTMIEDADLPERFKVRVPTLQIDRMVFLVWRRDYEIGVTFD